MSLARKAYFLDVFGDHSNLTVESSLPHHSPGPLQGKNDRTDEPPQKRSEPCAPSNLKRHCHVSGGATGSTGMAAAGADAVPGARAEENRAEIAALRRSWGVKGQQSSGASSGGAVQLDRTSSHR